MRINLRADRDNQKIILNYLEQNASDVLVEKINSGNKTMKDCWDYIYKQARENSKGNSACFEDKVVFGWAIHFFEEDSIQPTKEYINKTMSNGDVVRVEAGSEKKEKKVEEKKAMVKKDEGLKQITLFDLVGE